MRITKNSWLVASAVLTLAGAILFSARRVEAQYASPVRVMNSSAAPGVVSSIDDPGRTPYQSSQTVACSGTFCTFNFGTVPAGHRLVIQSAAALFEVSPTGGLALLLLLVHQSNPAAPTIPVTIPLVGSAGFGSGPAVTYVDAGQTPVVDAAVAGASFGFSSAVVLTGYMLDCSANSCAAIAH